MDLYKKIVVFLSLKKKKKKIKKEAFSDAENLLKYHKQIALRCVISHIFVNKRRTIFS